MLVIDDERPARNKVRRFLHRDPRFTVAGEAADGLEALERIEALRPELIVLDIQMPGLSGFEMLEALGEQVDCSVIFSTAHDEHALRAFEAHAIDYLLKPYDATRFSRALDKVYRQRLGTRLHQPFKFVQSVLDDRRRFLAIRTAEGAWVQLQLDHIVRIAAAGKFARVYSYNGVHTVRHPLRELAARLDPRFVQAHRGDIVNADAVAKVESWDHGDGLLTMTDGSTVVFTRTFRKQVLERFNR